MIDDVVTVVKRWRRSGAVRLTRSASRKKKTGAWTFATGGWGRQRYLPPRLRGDMATPMAIALDSSFNLLLISRILVDTNGNGQHHVIIGINNSGCALVIARRGETTHWGVDVNNAHLSMINPLNRDSFDIVVKAVSDACKKLVHGRCLHITATFLACVPLTTSQTYDHRLHGKTIDNISFTIFHDLEQRRYMTSSHAYLLY